MHGSVECVLVARKQFLFHPVRSERGMMVLKVPKVVIIWSNLFWSAHSAQAQKTFTIWSNHFWGAQGAQAQEMMKIWNNHV